MATITVMTQILTGNLGEWGNEDDEDVANRFARVLEQALRNDSALRAYEEQGHTVVIDIDVQRASGAGCGLQVYVDGAGEDDEEDEYDIGMRLEDRLPSVEQAAWETFCSEED